MICRCRLFQVSFGHNALRSRSVCSTFFAFDNPQRAANLWMCVSTGSAGIPYHCAMSTLAVFCDPPAGLSVIPIRSQTSSIDNLLRHFFADFWLWLGPNRFLESASEFSQPQEPPFVQVCAAANKAGVTSLTFLSVVCAESITATNSVYALVWIQWNRGGGVQFIEHLSNDFGLLRPFRSSSSSRLTLIPYQAPSAMNPKIGP